MVGLNFEEERISFTPIILYMNYINLLHDDYMRKNYKNITPRDFTYLVNIFYNQNCSQKDLAKMLFVSESNVTQITKRLEKNGYITRTPDEKNKSRKVLNLTENGKLILFTVIKEIFEWEGEFFKDYSAEDVEKFKKMIYEYSQRIINTL